jgi:lipopolysaccharide export system protein LptA
MRRLRFQVLSLIVFLLSGLILGGTVWSENLQQDAEKAKKKPPEPQPITIRSNTLEVDNKLKVVTFTGEVNARKEDFVLDCQKMLVYYENPPGQEKEAEPGTKISKIVAIGQVKIKRAQGGEATGDKAVYYQSEEKVVLTGRPVVRQGKDFVEGDRITMFLKESRSIVESSKDKKVKAVIFPKEGKK